MLVRPDGIVLEAPTSTVFWATADGALRTPAIEAGVLESITRGRIVGELEVEEGEWPLEDAAAAPRRPSSPRPPARCSRSPRSTAAELRGVPGTRGRGRRREAFGSVHGIVSCDASTYELDLWTSSSATSSA